MVRLVMFLILASGQVLADGVVVKADALREASGLVASRRHPGILWAHNDSGDGPRLFAIRTDGTLVATYTLTGALARDWEDIALGPGPKRGVDYLYVGDIGNNCECRTDLSIYRIPEPNLPAVAAASEIPVPAWERYPYRFPVKSANAEALLVDPRDGAVYFVDKVKTNTARLWRLPASASPGSTAVLEEVSELDLPIDRPCDSAYLVTGGDIAADGSFVVLTTYTHAFRWNRGPRESLADAMRRTPTLIRRHDRPDLEAVAIDPAGSGYWLLPEGHWPLLTRHRFDEPVAAAVMPGPRGLIDDFADGDLNNAGRMTDHACFGGLWYASATGGPGLPEPTMSATNFTLNVRLTRTAGGAAGAGLFVFTGLSRDWAPLDLSPFLGLRFRCRGNRPEVRVRLEGVLGGTWFKGEAAFVKSVPVTAAWRIVDIPWTAFAQAAAACPGPSCVPAFQPTGVFMIAWEVPAAAGDPEFALDDIQLIPRE